MYAALKCAIGPMPHMTAQWKDLNGNVLLEKSDQLNFQIRHFSQLYGSEFHLMTVLHIS